MKTVVKGSLLAATSFALALGASGRPAQGADAATQVQPLALQKIMKDLGAHMQTVADGISREDWVLVAQTAPLIASHPQPPLAEKTRILKFIGTDASKFRGFDHQTHLAAEALAQAAKRQDGAAVIEAFRDVQMGCFGCHQAFRQQFVDHFYGSKR